MPLLSEYARRKKIDFFLKDIPKASKILEVGSGDRWVGAYLTSHGWQNYIGLDVQAPADIVGDIRNWAKLGLDAESFDAIIAFEVVEHVAIFPELYDLLKPGGVLMVTTPLPHMDLACKILEAMGLNQRRTSPHTCLIYFEDIPLFEPINTRIVGLMSQWGKFRKPLELGNCIY